MRPWDEPPGDDGPPDTARRRLENLIFCGAAALVIGLIIATMGLR